MAFTQNSERYPVQESLIECALDSNGFHSQNGHQNGTGPSVQSLLNTSLTVQMFEAPNSDNIKDESARRAELQPQQTSNLRYNPKHPEYQLEAARIHTYNNWPIQIKQTPQQLSNAGLFFTGFDDCVQCFACGGKLRQWAYNDDPWTEHGRLFPMCPFVIEQKGEQFINQIFQEDVDIADQTLGRNRSYLDQERLSDMAALEEIRSTFLQMGYEDTVFRKAVIHLLNLGIQRSMENIVGILPNFRDENSHGEVDESDDYEKSLQENLRLKSKLFCLVCGRRMVGMLFLPCRHNKVCADCGNKMTFCPLCGDKVEDIIRTSLQPGHRVYIATKQ